MINCAYSTTISFLYGELNRSIVKEHGYVCSFEELSTPYMMVMRSKEITHSEKLKLKKVHDSLDALELRFEMKKLFKKIKEIQMKKRGRLF